MYCIKGRNPAYNRKGTVTRTTQKKIRIQTQHFMGGKSKKQNEAINVSWYGQKLHVVGMRVRKTHLYLWIQEDLNYNVNLAFRGLWVVQERWQALQRCQENFRVLLLGVNECMKQDFSVWADATCIQRERLLNFSLSLFYI